MGFSFKAEKVHILPESNKPTLAFVDLLINDDQIIHGVRVVDNGKNGCFVSLPQKLGKDKEGKDTWFDQVRFKNKESKSAISEVVLKAYEDKKQKND